MGAVVYFCKMEFTRGKNGLNGTNAVPVRHRCCSMWDPEKNVASTGFKPEGWALSVVCFLFQLR